MAEIRRYEDIMQQALANMIAGQDKITDFNNGSVIHTLLDTVSRIAERIYVAIRQGYNEVLRLIAYSIFKFRRKEGQKASGTVIFSRAKPLPAQTIIVSGTKVSFEDKEYITTEAGFIEAGETNSSPIKILAIKIGTSFNIPFGVIDTIKTAVPSDVALVTNNAAVTGGTKIESDTEFDERFKIFINGLSGTNCYAIMSAALELDCVRSVSIKNHKPPLRNIFNMSVYIDDGSGTASEETLAAVKLAIEGDGTAQHQGHLAPGVEVRILPPQTIPVDFSIIAYVYRANIQGAESEIWRIVTEYVNSLAIGKPVVLSEVISKIKKLSFIWDVQIVSPTDNILPSTDQIPRLGVLSIEIREGGASE
jgi:uncharacterized phage protein gp47/JayE